MNAVVHLHAAARHGRSGGPERRRLDREIDHHDRADPLTELPVRTRPGLIVSRRTPLAVAVVGALLVGGATTGTTHALWRDEATDAGQQRHLRHDEPRGVPARRGTTGIPALVAGGPAAVIEGTVRDTSSPGARNLRQDISVTDVVLSDATDQLKLSHLGVAVTPRPPSGCASNFTDAAAGEDAHLGRTAPGGPDASIDVCVTIVAKTGAPSSTGTLRAGILRRAGAPGRTARRLDVGQHNRCRRSTVTVGGPPSPADASCVTPVKRDSDKRHEDRSGMPRAGPYNVYESQTATGVRTANRSPRRASTSIHRTDGLFQDRNAT